MIRTGAACAGRVTSSPSTTSRAARAALLFDIPLSLVPSGAMVGSGDPSGPGTAPGERAYLGRFMYVSVLILHPDPACDLAWDPAGTGAATGPHPPSPGAMRVPPGRRDRICCRSVRFFARHREDSVPMYKEFLGEVVVWLIPIVILVGIALLVTSHG
ncbi:hypothetical protein Mame01_62080 [Microbispora amethystogenes]|nr:hypothetical protein Mame01_62080 [Microbispora amethystogenes]